MTHFGKNVEKRNPFYTVCFPYCVLSQYPGLLVHIIIIAIVVHIIIRSTYQFNYFINVYLLQ